MIESKDFQVLQFKVGQSIKHNEVTIWDLISNFLIDIKPLIFDNEFNFKPIRLIQIYRLYQMSILVLEFVKALVKHIKDNKSLNNKL
jgi:hypothetical protein